MTIVISRDVFFVKELNQVCSNQCRECFWVMRLLFTNILTDVFALTTFLNSLSALLVYYSRPCRAKCVSFLSLSVKLSSSDHPMARSFLCIAFIYWHAISKRCDCITWNFFRSSVKFLVINLKYESSNEYFFISS